MIIWFAAILLIAAIGLFIAAPLSDQLLPGRHSALDADSEQRQHEYALALQALRELEFDHAMGKLDEGDYHSLKDRLEKRALAAMSGREKAPRPRLADQAASAAQLQPITPVHDHVVHFCPQCGTRIDRAHHFCTNCGAALAVTAAAAS